MFIVRQIAYEKRRKAHSNPQTSVYVYNLCFKLKTTELLIIIINKEMCNLQSEI